MKSSSSRACTDLVELYYNYRLWQTSFHQLCPTPDVLRRCFQHTSTLQRVVHGTRALAQNMPRWRGLLTCCLWAACCGLALAQDLPPIVISGQSSGPAAVYTGAGAGAQDACNSHGPRKQCGT